MNIPDLHVKYKFLHLDAKAPTKAYDDDGAFDLYAVESLTIKPGEHTNVDCGIAIQVGRGWKYNIRGRSGLSRKGILVAPGLCDAWYCGSLKAVISNFSGQDYHVVKGERICQIEYFPVFDPVTFEKVEEFDHIPGTRGANGWGSSGRT